MIRVDLYASCDAPLTIKWSVGSISDHSQVEAIKIYFILQRIKTLLCFYINELLFFFFVLRKEPFF